MSSLRRALLVLGIAGAIVGLIVVSLLATSSTAALPGLWIFLTLVIGWGFIGVGMFAWLRRPESGVGALMVATGFAWYLCVLQQSSVPALFGVGNLLGSLFAVTAIHLLLSFPSGSLRRLHDRVLVVFGYVITVVGMLPAVLFGRPQDFGCEGCPDNVFLVTHDASLALTSLKVLNTIGVGFLLWTATIIVRRYRRATPPRRRQFAPLYFTGVALLGMLAAILSLQLIELMRVAAVSSTLADAMFYATLIPFGLMPYVFLAGLAQTRISRGGAVGRLVERLGEAPGRGQVRDALADALQDASLDLAYWVPEADRWVDANGRPYDLPEPRQRWAVTNVELEGRRVAAIVHDPSLNEDRDLVRAAGGAVALALENERLDAELRCKVEELRSSRERLIQAGLTERRGLERDLHDGAQQRLVSLALELRMARGALRTDPERAEASLESAASELELALQELRELARGIHPAVLSDRGLPAALETLAHRAPLPVRVRETPEERLPAPVELAAYYVVAEALTNVVKYADANRAEVQVGNEDGKVIVRVSDDGVGGADPGRGSGLRGLADRVGALDGRLEVDSERGRGTTVRARIPCG